MKDEKVAKVARFGHSQLLERIARIQKEHSALMDRRTVLARLCRELDADVTTLLQRGFDKAYRRIVEGI